MSHPPPPKVYLKTPTKCILFIYSPWCVGGLAPLAWFFVINISVRSPRGCAWWGCGGGRGGGLRPRTAQLCGDCSLSWWGLGSAGTCPAPGEGHVLLWGAVGLYTLFTGNKYSAAGSGLPAPPLALLWPIFKRFPAGRREDISPCSEPPPPPRGHGDIDPFPAGPLRAPHAHTHSRGGGDARHTSPAWQGHTWLMLKANPPGGTWQLCPNSSRCWHSNSPCRRAQQPPAPQSSSRWHRAPWGGGGDTKRGVKG